jgi:hypothetical protein
MLSSASRHEDRRRFPRYRVGERTRLRPNEWSSIQVGLLDISSHGFRAECEANLKIGGYVTLEVHGIGQVEAKIMWRQSEQLGAQFARPISLEHCAWVREPIETAADEPEPAIDETLIEMLARRAARRAGAL